jgi:hypothetical protein
VSPGKQSGGRTREERIIVIFTILRTAVDFPSEKSLLNARLGFDHAPRLRDILIIINTTIIEGVGDKEENERTCASDGGRGFEISRS